MAYRKLGRTSAHRKAMLRNLTTDLIVNEKIVTTETRAKEVRKFVEKMITLGKKGDLASRRRAAAKYPDARDLFAHHRQDAAPHGCGNARHGDTQIAAPFHHLSQRDRNGQVAEQVFEGH